MNTRRPSLTPSACASAARWLRRTPVDTAELPSSMRVQDDASSPRRLLELHAVDLSDDDSSVSSYPTSPSSATTVSSRSSSRSAPESKGGAASVRKKRKPAKELELGVQEEPQQQQQQTAQHLTSCVCSLLCLVPCVSTCYELLGTNDNRDLRTFANTIIAFLGSGVLGLPFAFKKCGILVRDMH